MENKMTIVEKNRNSLDIASNEHLAQKFVYQSYTLLHLHTAVVRGNRVFPEIQQGTRHTKNTQSYCNTPHHMVYMMTNLHVVHTFQAHTKDIGNVWLLQKKGNKYHLDIRHKWMPLIPIHIVQDCTIYMMHYQSYLQTIQDCKEHIHSHSLTSNVPFRMEYKEMFQYSMQMYLVHIPHRLLNLLSYLIVFQEGILYTFSHSYLNKTLMCMECKLYVLDLIQFQVDMQYIVKSLCLLQYIHLHKLSMFEMHL